MFISLEAYYIWIHPFLPILPPPETSSHTDRVKPLVQQNANDFASDLEPSTPLTLAISAILALIPCAEDTNYLSSESIVFRRKYAQYLAQATVEAIEMENEIPNSSVEPSKALDEPAGLVPNREPFHPRLPIELESIVALDMLSVYEYAQRGNMRKMQSRATQAFATAMMNFSLHSRGAEEDYFAEARRRVWWMTVRTLKPVLGKPQLWANSLVLPPVPMHVPSLHCEQHSTLTGTLMVQNMH